MGSYIAVADLSKELTLMAYVLASHYPYKGALGSGFDNFIKLGAVLPSILNREPISWTLFSHHKACHDK